MKNCHILFFCTILLSTINLIAQTASQKSLTETCDCVKKIDASLNEDQRTQKAMNCMVTSVRKYMPELKTELHITETDEKAAGMAVGRSLGAQLFQQCPEMASYLIKIAAMQNPQTTTSADINIDTLKLDPKICQQYRSGKHKGNKLFVNKKLMENPDITAFAEIKDGYVYDYTNKQSTITKWSLKYLSECSWQETLVESNDDNINRVFKKGDIITITAIGSTKDGGLWINSKMMGMDFIVLINKLP